MSSILEMCHATPILLNRAFFRQTEESYYYKKTNDPNGIIRPAKGDYF